MWSRGRRWVLLAVVVLFGAVPSSRAEAQPTIHHAGILRSVDQASQTLVIDERLRLEAPRPTLIHVTDGTVLVIVKRTGGEFRGERVPLDQLRVGDYLVVRGVDQGDRHHAEIIWSLGPAE